MSDIVKVYNPANAGTLTPEQLEGLQKLTNEEIKELAKAYPNTTMQRAFLLIVDGSKPANKQIPTLSTYENLYNLKVKNGLKNYVALNFKGNYIQRTVQPVRARKTEVLDLSDTELLTLPGFKTGNQTHKGETIPVTKLVSQPETFAQTLVNDENFKQLAKATEKSVKKTAKKSATKKSK